MAYDASPRLVLFEMNSSETQRENFALIRM